MQRIKETANTIHWLFRPIGFKENSKFKPTEAGVNNWYKTESHKLNIIQKSNPAALIGIIGLMGGLISSIIGVSKESRISKWVGGIVVVAGGILTALGLNKFLNLTAIITHKPKSAPVTRATAPDDTASLEVKSPLLQPENPRFSLSKEEEIIRAEIERAMFNTAHKVALELGLNSEALKLLMPKIIPLDEIRRITLDNKGTRNYFLSLPKELLEKHPRQLLELLPEDLKKELFPPDGKIPDNIKGNSGPIEDGGYLARYHLIGFAPQLTKKGTSAAQEIGGHEAYHAISTILRTALFMKDPESFLKALKEEVKDGICNGRPWKSFYTYGYAHQPFIPDKKLRNKIANATTEIIDKNFTNKEKSNLSPTNNKLSNDELTQLEEYFNLEEEHGDFVKLFNGDTRLAFNLLINYIEDEMFRILYITENCLDIEQMQTITIPNDVIQNTGIKELELTPRAMKLAYELVKNFPALFEGNSKMTLKDYTESKYNSDDKLSYALAHEEVTCKIATIQDVLNSNSSIRREVLDAKLKFYELGKKLSELKRKVFVTEQVHSKSLTEYYKIKLIGIKLANLNESINGKIEIIRGEISEDNSDEARDLKKHIKEKHNISTTIQLLTAQKEDNNKEYKDKLKHQVHSLLDASMKILKIYTENFNNLDSVSRILMKNTTEIQPLIDEAIDNEDKVQKLTNILSDKKLLSEIEETEKEILRILPLADIKLFNNHDFETVRLSAA